MRTPANQTVEGNGQSLRFVAVPHLIVLGYHRALSKRFPFAIYYRTEEQQVNVFAVLDCRRNPAWTRRRLE
jgi:hypothetical protein